MPKKSHKKGFKLSIFFKLLLASTLILVGGYTYQLVAYGTGPLSPFFADKNSINLVNGLDPDEATFLQKTIKSGTPVSKPVKVTVLNPISTKTEKAEVRIEKSNPPTTINDSLEAAEAAYLQKATTFDKTVNGGGTGVAATAPTVKVSVTNPKTGVTETSMVKLSNSGSETNVDRLTAAIETSVISANKNVSLSKVNHFCKDNSGQWLTVGSQSPYGTNNQCRTCMLFKEKGQNKYNAYLTDDTSECAPAYKPGTTRCTIYAEPSSLNKTNSRLVYSMDKQGSYTDPVVLFATGKTYNMSIKINGKTYRKTYRCIDDHGVGRLK